MKALVGVDGSSNSFAALQFTGRLLSPERDELVLVYASPDASFAHQERMDEAVLERARSSLSRAVFDEAISRLPGSWQARVERLEIADWPSVAILSAVEQARADLVVVGFRGTSLFERFVLGSVSRAVVHSATVPVLVVKSEIDDEKPTEVPARAADGDFHVLVAYGGTSAASRIAASANQISWSAETVGAVITVVPPLFVAELPEWLKHQARDPDVAAMAAAWQTEHAQSIEEARRKLVEFQQTLPECFAKAPPAVVEGRPTEKILEKLSTAPFDLVIVGSRGTGRVERLLLGSTSEQILSKAPCSVLIAR